MSAMAECAQPDIAKVIFDASPVPGMIMLPLLFYHPLQLIVCSLLARRDTGRRQGSYSRCRLPFRTKT
jgi:predicted Na+-dependent transporter